MPLGKLFWCLGLLGCLQQGIAQGLRIFRVFCRRVNEVRGSTAIKVRRAKGISGS